MNKRMRLKVKQHHCLRRVFSQQFVYKVDIPNADLPSFIKVDTLWINAFHVVGCPHVVVPSFASHNLLWFTWLHAKRCELAHVWVLQPAPQKLHVNTLSHHLPVLVAHHVSPISTRHAL